MSYKTFKTFSDVKIELGFTSKPNIKQPKEEKEIKCKICGAPMKRIAGTNIIACTGEIKTKDNGLQPCENYIILDN